MSINNSEDLPKEDKKVKGKQPKAIRGKKTTSQKRKDGLPDVQPAANTVKIFRPTLPTVNMTPSSVGLQYQKVALFKKILLSMASVIILFLGIGAGNIVLGALQETNNDRILAEIEALRTQSGGLEPYRVYVDGVELLKNNMATVMAQDLDMGIILSAINSAAQDNNVGISELKLNETLSGAETNSCSDPDPANTEQQVGCIVISGSAASRDNILNFFAAVESNNGLDNGFINAIGAQGDAVTFEGTITIRRQLFTQKFNFLLQPIGEILLAGGIVRDENFERFTPTQQALDPRFTSCFEAIVAGYGPYSSGINPEYGFYSAEDTTQSGVVCDPANYPDAVTQRDSLTEESNSEQNENLTEEVVGE